MDLEAWSSGQVLSKIWLAQELEPIARANAAPARIVLLGGWYGLTNFILRCRSNIIIDSVVSVDLDANATAIAEKINETWLWQNHKFKSLTLDANNFDYKNINVVINTSVEHIESDRWFKNIPEGCLVALQSNNMKHNDHCHNHKSLEDLKKEFPFTQTLYSGIKLFKYETWEFYRFMTIGIK